MIPRQLWPYNQLQKLHFCTYRCTFILNFLSRYISLLSPSLATTHSLFLCFFCNIFPLSTRGQGCRYKLEIRTEIEANSANACRQMSRTQRRQSLCSYQHLQTSLCLSLGKGGSIEAKWEHTISLVDLWLLTLLSHVFPPLTVSKQN